MKRTILTLAILASVSLTSFATTETIQRKGRKDFPKELKLTQEQKKQFKEINEDFKKQVKAVKLSRIAPEAQEMKIKTLQEDKKEAINKILTAEQQAQFAKKMTRGNKAKRMHHSDSQRGHKGQHHGERGEIFKDLNLTDSQKKEMQALRKKHKEEINKILTPEQKAQFEERSDLFKESRENRRKDMQNLKKLDEAGKAKFKELKETYQKEKGAVERSRIAPDMQKMKLDILKKKFEEDKAELFKTVK